MPTLQELIKFELCSEYGCLCKEFCNDPKKLDRYRDVCDHYANQAERVVARLKQPITELLLSSPSIEPVCASPEKREEWRKLIEDKLGYATQHAEKLISSNDPYKKQGWSAFILAMWDYVRKEFSDMIGDDPEKQRIYRMARRLAESECHDPDMVVMGPPNGHPWYSAKNTTAITAPMQPIWALYYHEAESAIALVDEDMQANKGFGE